MAPERNALARQLTAWSGLVRIQEILEKFCNLLTLPEFTKVGDRNTAFVITLKLFIDEWDIKPVPSRQIVGPCHSKSL